MRIQPAAFCVLMSVACTAAESPARSAGGEPSPRPAVEMEHSGGFAFPRAFPELSMRLVDVHTYDNPMLGSRLAYVRGTPELRVDVYVYPMAPQGTIVPDTVRRRLVRDMFDLGRASIREYERRGRYSELRFSDDSQLRLPSRVGPVDGWHSSVDMLFEGEPVQSRLYVFSLMNTYVKFRATYPREDADEVAAIVDEFVAALLAEAEPGVATPAPVIT